MSDVALHTSQSASTAIKRNRTALNPAPVQSLVVPRRSCRFSSASRLLVEASARQEESREAHAQRPTKT